MILFVYGNDSYLLRQQVRVWIRQYQEKNKDDASVLSYVPKNFNFLDCKSAILSAGMFSQKKLAIFDGFSASTHSETLITFMKEADIAERKDIFFIFSEHLEVREDKREAARLEAAFEKNKLVLFLKKNSFTEEKTDTPRGTQLVAWVRKEFEKRGVHIDTQALTTLIAITPQNLWLLSSEIEKLSLYKKTISNTDVLLLISRHITTDIFKTIDAISLRNISAALYMIHEHLMQGDSPLQLLSMFSFQLRNIYIAKKLNGASFPKALSVHPFVEQKARSQSRNFSLEEISHLYQKLFETDVAIKTGTMTQEAALDMFVANAL